jgi:RNase P subunit RPR2
MSDSSGPLTVVCDRCGHIQEVKTDPDRLKRKKYVYCSLCHAPVRNPYFDPSVIRREERVSGVLVVCRKCGHEWRYTGSRSLKVVRCPACAAHSPEPKEQRSDGIQAAQAHAG